MHKRLGQTSNIVIITLSLTERSASLLYNNMPSNNHAKNTCTVPVMKQKKSCSIISQVNRTFAGLSCEPEQSTKKSPKTLNQPTNQQQNNQQDDQAK